MIDKFKVFSIYQIDSIETLFMLPETTIDMILTECFNELKRIPRNIYNIGRENISSIDINTKIEFLSNIDKYIEEEQMILDNIDVLSDLEDFNIALRAVTPDERKYTPSSNILFESLFDFQKQAFNKFKKDKHILVSKTGSGKTITALAIAEQLYSDRKINGVIVILANDEQIFINELSKHLPMYSHGKYKTMTYYNMHKKLADIRGIRNYLFILDEVHLLKNDSNRGNYIKSLNIKYLLGLSATIFDKKSDIDTLFSNLGVDDTSDLLIKMTTDKEPVTNIVESKLYLTKNEQDILKLSILKTAGSMETMHKTMQMLSLRGDRIAELLMILEKHRGDKVLVFTNYISTANKLHEMIEDSMLITGGMDKTSVQSKLRNFFYGKFQALISTSVLNQSYNLQQANVIVFYDFNYDSIKAQQTEGRVVRIGQTKECFIYYIYYAETEEETIYNSIMRKRKEYEDTLEEMANNG